VLLLSPRLTTGNHISIIGGIIWRTKLLTWQNLGLHLCGSLHQHSHYPRKVGRPTSSFLTQNRVAKISHLIFPSIGYLPQNLYCLDSCYGSLDELKALLQKMNGHHVRAMADVVINHRIGTTQGSNGMYNRYDGIPVSWDEHAVTSCSGGKVTKLTCFVRYLFYLPPYLDNLHAIPGE
jgi:hypothetical protein